jgi:hypothetical protein
MFLPDLRQKEHPHSGCLQATSKPEIAASDRIFAGTVPPASEGGCHANCNCSNTR